MFIFFFHLSQLSSKLQNNRNHFAFEIPAFFVFYSHINFCDFNHILSFPNVYHFFISFYNFILPIFVLFFLHYVFALSYIGSYCFFHIFLNFQIISLLMLYLLRILINLNIFFITFPYNIFYSSSFHATTFLFLNLSLQNHFLWFISNSSSNTSLVTILFNSILVFMSITNRIWEHSPCRQFLPRWSYTKIGPSDQFITIYTSYD